MILVLECKALSLDSPGLYGTGLRHSPDLPITNQQVTDKGSRSGIIAELASGHEEPDWLPISRLLPPFYPQLGGRTVCLEVSCVDGDRLVVWCFGSEPLHDPRKYPTSIYRLQWVYKVLYGQFFLGATHQGNPLRLKKIIPLKTRLLYTWALPRPNGKYGRSRPISSSLSQ